VENQLQDSVNEPTPEANSYGVGSTACGKLCQQVAHMTLDRFFAEEEAVADLAVREAVADELQDLDLARRRLLLELCERDDRRGRTGVGAAARGYRLEPFRVSSIAAQDLAALGCVHGDGIGSGRRRL
jgi:hypothetical protein